MFLLINHYHHSGQSDGLYLPSPLNLNLKKSIMGGGGLRGAEVRGTGESSLSRCASYGFPSRLGAS